LLKYALGFFVSGDLNILISMNNYDDQNFDEQAFGKLIPLTPSEFINCTFSYIDFTNSNLTLCKFIECQFTNCNLSNVSLKNSVFRDTHFNACKLLGLNWAEAQTISSPTFSESVLDYAVFQSLSLIGVSFKNCSMKEVDFYEANLSKSNFTDSVLSQASFNKANLSQADFRGALDYFIDPGETNIKKAKFSMPEALALLQALEVILD
jgi:fluoroquinolone resistance protein